MLTEQQKQAARLIFGDDLLQDIIAGAEAQTKALEQAGLRYKSRTAARTKGDVADIDVIVQEVLKRLAEQNQTAMTAVAKLADRLEELEAAVNDAGKKHRAKAAVETPRQWHDLQPPAPAGKKAPPATGAAAYFTGPPRVNGNNPFYQNGGEK